MYLFPFKVKKQEIPVLILATDYASANVGKVAEVLSVNGVSFVVAAEMTEKAKEFEISILSYIKIVLV